MSAATLGAPLALYLVRHGETAWSLSGQHTGRTDLPLTPQGQAQARALAPWLAGVGFAQVFTSPRLRAQATCALAGLGQASAQGQSQTSSPAQVEPDLAEWDYGDYEGLRSAEIHQHRPGWDVWADGCPGGESPADISARADRLIARLLAQPQAISGPVALFSHGQFGRALAARWIGLPVAQGRHFAMAPASVGILGSAPDRPQRRVISLWNATAQGLSGPAAASVGAQTPDGAPP